MGDSTMATTGWEQLGDLLMGTSTVSQKNLGIEPPTTVTAYPAELQKQKKGFDQLKSAAKTTKLHLLFILKRQALPI